jgi:hypothetical protein
MIDTSVADAAAAPVAGIAADRPELLRHLLMVAGAGGRAEAMLAEIVQTVLLDSTRRGTRSCLDGGSDIVVSVSTARRRRLGLYLRAPDAADSSVSRWLWWRIEADDPPRRGWRHLYAGETPGVWPDVLRTCQEYETRQGVSGSVARLHAWHAALGPSARIYSVLVPLDGAPWIAWQLDPRLAPERALAACGVSDRVGASIVASVTGLPAAGRGGPWSLAMAIDGSRWRLGTSAWARCPEFVDKRRRLAAAVADLGGDQRFVEAVYKLVEARQPEQVPSRIGRAIEVELPFDSAEALTEVEFFLSVPGVRSSFDGRGARRLM